MRLYKSYFILLLLSIVVMSCAFGPKFIDIEQQIPQIKPGESRIYFFRKMEIKAGMFQPPITVDGKDVGKVMPGGFFYVDLPPGDYTIGHRSKAYIGYSGDELHSMEQISLSSGQILYIELKLSSYRASSKFSSFKKIYLKMRPVEPNQAKRDMRELEYVGTNLFTTDVKQ